MLSRCRPVDHDDLVMICPVCLLHRRRRVLVVLFVVALFVVVVVVLHPFLALLLLFLLLTTGAREFKRAPATSERASSAPRPGSD
ncbi:hypothetical protein QYE76_015666 [Lolium multiflorum]|jgi:hypothetical protein|uniref:Transmembrane protein n=1 Tax=Lolium multiflorum TaxID=4521 RepID=A0AAD8U8I7_LOLMU|nr:hypothetical protein QYE76_015666 [Lolium multiflorum]